MPSLGTKEVVKCDHCGSIHLVETDNIKAQDDFIVIHGNITIGMNGGVVGNNLDQDGKVNRISVYCNKKECLSKLIKMFDIKNYFTVR